MNFTPWLVEEDMDLIGKVLGLDLETVGSEQAVGDFAVDILARDLGRNRRVIIENQLEEIDHKHLGQLITYAAGLDAGTVVWVSREFREEHRQALDWLNRGGGGSTEFFGVVVELLQVDDSKPAVNLRLIASPNNWSRRAAPNTTAEDPSGKYARYQQFFQRLIDELREKQQVYQRSHWTAPKLVQLQHRHEGVPVRAQVSLREGGFVQNCTFIRERAPRMSVLLTRIGQGKGEH